MVEIGELESLGPVPRGDHRAVVAAKDRFEEAANPAIVLGDQDASRLATRFCAHVSTNGALMDQRDKCR
jgi:hypothetical protein